MASKKLTGAAKAAIGIGVVAVLAIAATITMSSGVSRRHPAPPPAPPAPEERLLTPDDIRERVRERIAERASDPEYMEKLNALAKRYGELDALKGEALREFAEWQRGFLASNEAARAIAMEIASLDAATPAADIAALRGELKAMFAADPRGAYLLDKQEKIEAAYEQTRIAAASVIGARAREQAQAHAAEEKAAADADFRARVGMGQGPRPGSNRLVRVAGELPRPRGENWWTNNVAPPKPLAPPPHPADGTEAAPPANAAPKDAD